MPQEQISLAVMGMDQHENGVIAVGRILREAQMKVTYLGKLLSPTQVVEGAVNNNADVIGVSCHSWEYLTLVPTLIEELRNRGLTIPVMIGGSVITAEDAAKMKAFGVAAVFGAGSPDEDIMETARALARAG